MVHSFFIYEKTSIHDDIRGNDDIALPCPVLFVHR